VREHQGRALSFERGQRLLHLGVGDARYGDPLQALSQLSPSVAALHVYGHPRTPKYLASQASFARDHPWLAVQRLEAVGHFPTLEVPEETAGVIREFIEE